MKNMILALIVCFGSGSLSIAGECVGNSCVQPRKVVTVTKSVVRETVRLPKRLLNSCTNGSCRSRSVTVVR